MSIYTHTYFLYIYVGHKASKRLKMLDFDPRSRTDKCLNQQSLRSSIQLLTNAVPETCYRLMWGVNPTPPDFIYEVEVASNPSLEDQVTKLIHKTDSVPDDKYLNGPIDHELVTFIEELTQLQDKCTLWHELHIGRLTSSIFGQILHTKNSPSLLQSILYRK